MHRSSNESGSERTASWRHIVGLSMMALVGVGLPASISAQTEGTVQQKITLTAIPAERSLPIPPPASALSPDSGVLQRINDAHAGARLGQMDFLGEGTVTVQTGDGPLSLGVAVLRNGFRGQHTDIKQGDGKSVKIAAGPIDPIIRRVLVFMETQHDRGLAGLLQSAARNAVVRDGGAKDGMQALVVLDTDGTATRYLIDTEASRVTRFEFQRGRSPDPSGRSVPNLESYVFSDIRIVTGLATPFRVEHYINGARQEELQFSSVRYVPANRDRTPRPLRGGLQ